MEKCLLSYVDCENIKCYQYFESHLTIYIKIEIHTLILKKTPQLRNKKDRKASQIQRNEKTINNKSKSSKNQKKTQ